MSISIGRDGLVMFGPQWKKGARVLDANWHAHKATETSLGVADNVQLFGGEIGDAPMPSGAYKGGYGVGGGITLNPRLEDSVGWLLYALMGKVATQKAIVYEGLLVKKQLTTSVQTINAASMVTDTLPTSHGKIAVRVFKDDTTVWTGIVTVAGAGPKTESFNFSSGPGAGQRADGIHNNLTSGDPEWETIVGNEDFTDVTTITLPALAEDSTDVVYVAVGYEDAAAKAHQFTHDSTDPSMTKWLQFRKAIPKPEGGVVVGETYKDIKLVNAALNLVNDGPITFACDTLGCDYLWEEDPAWANDPSFEDYESVPMSTVAGGYIKIPAFSSEPMPVVGMTIAWQNAPADDRVEREYGKAYRPDITILDRRMVFQLTVKYDKAGPDLYRACQGNSKSAAAWSPKPFTTRVDVTTFAPFAMTGSKLQYGMRVQINNAVLGVRNGIPLSGTDTVMLRLFGTALNTGSSYASWTLTNLEADYTWPSSETEP